MTIFRQQTQTVLKFKALLPVLQNFCELLAPGCGMFGFLFSSVVLGTFFTELGQGRNQATSIFYLKLVHFSVQSWCN